MAIARGELRPGANDPKVWFPTLESLAKVLSEDNRALLQTIAQTSPESLTELAEQTGRYKSNLSRTLKTLARYKLVRLDNEHGRLRPRVDYERIELAGTLVKAA